MTSTPATTAGAGSLVGDPLRRVLLVEDGAADRRLITEMLVEAGVERADVVASGSLAGARHQLTQMSVDCVLLDLTLPDATGLDGVRVLSSALPGVPLVIVSGHPPDSLAYAAMAEGADEFLCKQDLSSAALVDALRRAEQRRRGSARAQAQLASTNLALEAIEVPAVAVDGSGVIVATNHAWLQSALVGGASPSRTGVGVNYLTVCDSAVGEGAEAATHVAAGIRSVLGGDAEHFSSDYAFTSEGATRWFTVRVSSTDDGGGGAVITHLDLTALKETERRIKGDRSGISTLFDESAPIFALLDGDGTARYVSPFAAELFGSGGEQGAGVSLLGALDPVQRDRAEQCLSRAAQRAGSREQLILDVCDGDKRWRTLDLTVCNLLDDPSVAAVVLTGSDITTVHRLKVTRHLETRLLRRLPAAVVVTDERGAIVYWNDRASELYGYRADEVLGSQVDSLEVWPAWAGTAGSPAGGSTWVGDHVARSKDARALPVHATLQRIEDPSTGFSGVVGTSIDITERRQLEERLAFEARHDPLTGLLNRRALVDHLDAALARAARRRGGGVAVLYVDLDNFKEVNDNLNHQAGDEVLRAVSDLVGSVLGPSDVLARLGGDEFVVCAEGCASIDDAVGLANRIIAVLSVPFRHHNQGVVIGASIGVSFSSDGSLAEELMRDADIAMYEAKEGGKGRTVAFDETLRNQLRRTRLVTAELDAALGDERIVTFFQPEVDMATGALIGFEALVRWDHPTRGLVSPTQFVPVAEESELINRLGTTVLRDACQALAAWNGRYPDRRLKVAVNVSARQLHTADFAANVLDIVGVSGIAPQQVCVEITESTVADDDTATAVLGVLRAAGVSIAIDDFGTGFSSLHRLQRLPIDDLKIDRTFVSQMLDDSGSRVIVSAVVGLARSLGLGIVAEGVERDRQASELCDLGCHRAQGFLWSPPVDFLTASRMIDEQPWLVGSALARP